MKIWLLFSSVSVEYLIFESIILGISLSILFYYLKLYRSNNIVYQIILLRSRIVFTKVLANRLAIETVTELTD